MAEYVVMLRGGDDSSAATFDNFADAERCAGKLSAEHVGRPVLITWGKFTATVITLLSRDHTVPEPAATPVPVTPPRPSLSQYDLDRSEIMQRVALLGASDPGASSGFTSPLGMYRIEVGEDFVIRSYFAAATGGMSSKPEARVVRKGDRCYLKFDV